MLMNLLDGWFKFSVGEGAFYAVFGFIFVVLGITLLIVIFTLLGLIMKKVNSRKGKAKETKSKEPAAAVKPAEEGVSAEIIAVISAAIAAYYEGSAQKCDFVVRRIKRL